jgi:uncharacterized protein YbbK (DUF523 family)
MEQGLAVPVCPEVLGELSIPRPPSEIQGPDGSSVIFYKATVKNVLGEDVTHNYVQGSFEALYIGLQSGCTKAILKARSPACGLGEIYDGSFSRKLKKGNGVLAALLLMYGFQVFTDELVTDPSGFLVPCNPRDFDKL